MTRRPALDFARPQPDFTRARTYRLAGCCLAVGLALGFVAWSYQNLQAQRRDLLAAQTRLQAPPKAPVERRWSAAEDSAVRGMLAQLATPWETLFAALEKARGDNVTVSGLRCDGEERQLLVNARASDFAAAAQFVDRLAALPVLTQVTLLQSDSPAQSQGVGVTFSVSARWKEATP